MKKIFTLLFALVAFVSNSMAQHGAMKTVAAIETVVTEKSADDAVYNLNGLRVGNDHKGLVIKNGKKYFEKLKNSTF